MIEKFLNDLILPDCLLQIGPASQVGYAEKTLDNLDDFMGIFGDVDLYFLGGVKPELHSDRAGDDDIRLKNYLFFDFDVRKQYPEITDEEIKTTIFEKLRVQLTTDNILGDWRYMVFTGNGIHVYYFFDPIEVKDKALWREGMLYFCEMVEGVTGLEVDKACVNVARISRLPGSQNHKSDPPKDVIILEGCDAKCTFVNDMLDIGRSRIEEKKAQAQVRAKEVISKMEKSGDDMYSKINSIPVGQVVALYMGWEFDGRKFNEPGKSKKKACYVDSRNVFFPGGSDHIPDNGKVGYSPFSFIKLMLQRDNPKAGDREVFFWFKDHFPELKMRNDEMPATVTTSRRIDSVFEKLKTVKFDELSTIKGFDGQKLFIRGAVTRLGAMSYTGKSKMAYFIVHQLLKNGYRGAIVSTEVPSEIVLCNMLMLEVDAGFWDILKRRVALPSGIEERYRNLEIFDVKDTKNQLAIIERLILDAKKDGPLDFLMLDYCQMITPVGFAGSEFAQMSKYAFEIQEMAQRHNISVIDLSQLNEQGLSDAQQKFGHIPFKNSKDLYNAADIAVMLKRDRTPGVTNNLMQFDVRKHKYGDPIVIDVTYTPRNGRFEVYNGKEEVQTIAEHWSDN